MEIKEKNDELLAETEQNANLDQSPGEAFSQIHRRAYQIWQERGGNSGSELEDWLQAEAEINATLGTPEQDAPRKNKKPRYRQQAAAG